MLLDCHYLNAVISVSSDTRQNFLAELAICTDLFFFLSHTNMALVYQQRSTFGSKLLVLEYILLLRSPNLCTEYLRSIILHHSTHPSRNSFATASVPIYLHLVVLSMRKGLTWHTPFPNTPRQSLQLIFGTLFPIREVSYEHNPLSIRCPFAEHPTT